MPDASHSLIRPELLACPVSWIRNNFYGW